MKSSLNTLAVILLCLNLFYPCALAQEGEVGPTELNKRAYFLLREARKAHSQKEERLVYDKYIAAIGIYKKIAQQFPDWRPDAIRAKIEQYQKQANEIGERIFQLPEGYIRIWPGMIREGRRYYQGQALVSKVKEIGEDQYEVSGYTVTLVRAGPLIGAQCNGPDFKYRGSKYNYACKHIWAVILKENLLSE